MPRTPDEFPGERYDEGIVLEDLGLEPSLSGGIRFVSGSFAMRDKIGVFDPRTGSFSEPQHENLHTLVHDLAQNFFEEVTYVCARVSNVTMWTDATKTQKIRETQITYSNALVSQSIEIQYDESGLETARMTYGYSYIKSRLQSITGSKTGGPI